MRNWVVKGTGTRRVARPTSVQCTCLLYKGMQLSTHSRKKKHTHLGFHQISETIVNQFQQFKFPRLKE